VNGGLSGKNIEKQIDKIEAFERKLCWQTNLKKFLSISILLMFINLCVNAIKLGQCDDFDKSQTATRTNPMGCNKPNYGKMNDDGRFPTW
jgi:hypothetical protein